MSSLTNENAAASFAAIGSPARLAVLAALVRSGETGLTVGALQARLAMPASTLAHHLGALVRAGVVTQTKEGRTVTNRAHLDHLAALADFLLAECCQDARLADQGAADD
jgi:ArsR family transcriptional regulator